MLFSQYKKVFATPQPTQAVPVKLLKQTLMNTQNSESKGSLASTERKQEKRKLPPRSGMKTSGSAVKTSTSKITPISNGMFFAGNLMTEKK